MTIKWVKADPLVMNGEPYIYGSRLTVRQLLELRRNGYDLTAMLTDHPELRLIGVATAFRYAGQHRDRYAEFFETDGTLAGPGFNAEEAARLPAHLRLAGIVVKTVEAVASDGDGAAGEAPADDAAGGQAGADEAPADEAPAPGA